MAVLIKLPFILNIAKTYPLENWGAKVRSMIFAGQSVLNCTIGNMFFDIFLQIISLFVIVLVIVVMSALLKIRL